MHKQSREFFLKKSSVLILLRYWGIPINLIKYSSLQKSQININSVAIPNQYCNSCLPQIYSKINYSKLFKNF